MEQGLRTRAGRGPAGGGRFGVHLPVDSSVSMQKLAEAQRYYTRGNGFLRAARAQVLPPAASRGSLADALLLLARWDEAAGICDKLLAIPGARPRTSSTRCASWVSIRGRRGDPGVGAGGTRALRWPRNTRSGDGPRGHERCARNCTGYRASLVRPPRKPARPTTRPPGGLIRGGSGHWSSGCSGWGRGAAELPAGCRSRTRGRWPATGRRGRGLAAARPARMTPRWPGSAAPTRPRCATALAAFDALGARAAAAAARWRMKDLGVPGDPARPARGHPGRPRRADRPRAAGAGAAGRGPAGPVFPGGCSSPSLPCTTTSPPCWPRPASIRTAAAREAARMGIGTPA